MAARIRIAAAQHAVGCDAAANGASVRALMRAAHGQGARLVQFPEGSVSGYPSGAEAKQALSGWRIDWSAVRDQLERIAALAAELRLWVVVGCSHRLTAPHRPHNSLYVVSDEGRLVGRYDKRVCSHTEITGWYSPGCDPLVFDVDGFRFGTALCVEIHFPELFAEYRALGVDCVLLSSFSEDPVFDVMARAHAAVHSSWVSVSVPAQCSRAMPSGVSGPHGYWLGRCPSDGSQAVVCVDLDRGDPALDVALNKARPWRAAVRRVRARGEGRVRDPRSDDRTHW